MKRFQLWSSLSLMMAAAIAMVAGCTRMISVNPTAPALVLTATPTITPTAAVVPSPTPETIQVVPDGSSPGSSIQIPGATAIPVLEISATNSGSDPANMTSLKVTASGSGNDASGISAVALYLDANNNGIVDGPDTLLAFGTYTFDNGTVTLNFTNTVAPSSTANYLVVYSFSPSAPAGTYQATLANNGDVTGTNGTTGLSVQVNGAPVNGAVVTIVGATNTFTTTATNSPSNSPTNTPIITNTATRTPTNSPTPSITNTPIPGANTNTATNSPTKTPTLTATKTPTNSPSNTPTNTPLVLNTPTSTPTLCTSVNFQPTYAFDSNSIDCWQLNGATSIVTALGISSTTTHSGSAGALQVSINNTSGTVSTAQIELDYTVPQNFTGAAITFFVNVDAGLLDLSGFTTGIAVEDQNTGFTGYEANYTGIGGNSATWIQIVRNTGIVNGSVIQLGIQLYNIPAGGSGNLYVDDVQITLAGPTATPTVTPAGPTATPTNTPTNTPSGCPLPVGSAYNFDTDINCWSTTNVQGSSSIVWNPSAPAGSTSGGGALDATVTYPDTTSGAADEDFEIALPANTDLTGKIITFNVYINAIGGASYGGLQPYIKSGASLTFCDQTWLPAPSLGAWHTYQINLSNTCTSFANDVRAFGIQVFTGGGTGGTGHVFIDDVTITTALPPTATPTPNSYIWTYEDGTNQYWTGLDATATGSGGCNTSAVTAFGETSTYGFDMIIPPGVINNANNTFRAEVSSAGGSPVIGAGLDWNALNLTSVVVDYYINASAGYMGTQYPYVMAGGTPTRYGGTYGGAPSQCNGGSPACNYQGTGAWYSITWSPSGPNWSTDKTNVSAVGFEVNISANAAFPGEEYILDNIRLQ